MTAARDRGPRLPSRADRGSFEGRSGRELQQEVELKLTKKRESGEAPKESAERTAEAPAGGAMPSAEGSGSDSPKEPSLGPACLVVAILSLAVLSSVCAFGSWFMFSDQYPLAVRSINEQLIPWVQTSQLSPGDQAQIVGELQRLLPRLEARSIDKQQLARLHNCLQDNPVLLWGGIESILAQARQAGLTETEQLALQRVTERMMRAAAERKLSRNDLEFTIQNCSKVRQHAQSLEVVSPLTAEQIREFVQRAEQIVDRNGIPNEPYNKTPAEAFHMLIDASLTLPSE